MPDLKFNSEAEWLALRDAHIGGSEVAGLFCDWRLTDGGTVTLHAYEDVPEGAVCLGACSPYTTPYKLFTTKAGLAMPEDWNPSERMQAGTYFEPAMAQWANAKWGWKIRKVRRYSQHPEVRGWGCSVDYEIHGPGMDPVEFKNIDGLVAKNKWVIEKDEVIAAPLHVQLQLQHYLAARGAKRGWIVACVGGNKLVRGEFTAHEPTHQRMREAITAFWEAVDAGTPPPFAVDYESVSDAFALGAKTAAPVDLTGDAEAAMLARRMKRWAKHAKFIETALDNIKGRLAVKVGEAPKAVGDGFRVSWPVINIPAKTVPARIQAERNYRGGLTVTLTEKKGEEE